LQLEQPDRGPLLLQGTIRSLVTDKYPQQIAEVYINGKKVGRFLFRVERGAGIPQPVSLEVPAGVVGDDGNFTLLLRTPDSISPDQLGVSTTDGRALGVGVVSLRLTPSPRPASVTAKGPEQTVYVEDPGWPLEAKFDEGCYGQESRGQDSWRWCSNLGILRITNKSQEPAWGHLSADVQTTGDGTVQVGGPLFSDELKTNSEGLEWERTVSFPPGESVLKFTSNAKQPVPGGARVQAFAVHNFTLTHAEAPAGGVAPPAMMTRPVEVKWGPGSYQEEAGSIGTWHWCSAACQVLLNNPASTQTRVRISMRVQSGYEQTAKLAVEGPAVADSVPVSFAGRDLSYTLVVPPGQQTLKMSCDGKRVDAPTDPRYMVFRVINLAVTRADD
jgi:hypothetical protein